jgi:hypothetical protein
MKFINVGAIDYNTGDRFLTKKSLKEAVAVKADVIFDQTGFVHDDSLPGHIDLRDLLNFAERTTDWELSVVGPDPYQSRKWYAKVTVRDGVIKVA